MIYGFAPHRYDSTLSCLPKLNAAVFEKVNQLVPSFTPLYAMADFEEAPVATFKSVYVDANVAVCVGD